MGKLPALFWVMLKIGAFTFGGGLAMIPQISHELVDKKRWIESGDLVDIVALSQSMPGVLAVNAAFLVGHRVAGWPGAFTGALAAVLPSFLVLAVVTLLYQEVVDDPYILGAMRGIRAAVTGLLLATVVKLRPDSLQNVLGWLLFLAAIALMLFTEVSAMWVILGGLLAGLAALIWVRIKKKSI